MSGSSPSGPHLRYDAVRVGEVVAKARRAQGVVEGKLAVLRFEQQQSLAAEAWSQETMATAATLRASGWTSLPCAVQSPAALVLATQPATKPAPMPRAMPKAFWTSWTTR